MSIINDIRNGFANLDAGRFRKIKLDTEHSVWVYRVDEGFGVGVEISSGFKYSEKFATAKMYTRTENIGGVTYNFLVLENREESLRNEFAGICVQFCDPGAEGTYRKALLASPSEWWKRMTELLGNSVRNQTPHSVLGELIVYLKLLEKNAAGVSWQGPANKSHDIETEDVDYEVKSTIARYGAAITITGQHQLETSSKKVLKLLFCRFEEVSSGGDSINSLVSSLKEKSIDRDDLEKKLAKIGFEEGSSARLRQYLLHDEIRAYTVDENFPKITGASFVGGIMPEPIIQLTYQLDLSSLRSEIFSA
jgi:hypothetical protein